MQISKADNQVWSVSVGPTGQVYALRNLKHPGDNEDNPLNFDLNSYRKMYHLPSQFLFMLL